ncbi:MAG: ABC transporter ATP-binding protein [Deltaproteobacteria bacterium]
MNVIEVKNLTKKYKKALVVNGVNFTVKSGEILGILGPNGAGKTTLLSLISTLLKPEQGELYFNQENIVKNPKAIRPYLGFVPQDIALYETLTVKDNMCFWGGIYGGKGPEIKDRVSEVLEIVGLKDKENERVEHLSGGMKRRLNIAAALIHKPQIVIMDEPTVGIDIESREYIISAVKKLKDQGVIVIYTSHYIEEAEFLCDKIMIMNRGKVIAMGTVNELMLQANGVDKKEERLQKPVLEKIYLELLKKDR